MQGAYNIVYWKLFRMGMKSEMVEGGLQWIEGGLCIDETTIDSGLGSVGSENFQNM